MSDGDFEGRVALVTGASRGIGEASARRFAAEGAAVVLVARSASDIERVAGEIVDAGGRATAVACDIARHADVEAAVGRCREAYGRLDVVVNNAGLIDPIARLADSDPDAWGAVIDVNLKGVYHVLRAALPLMLEAPRSEAEPATVVNISSLAATVALEGWSHYCASKAAVLSLTRSVHEEYAGRGIRAVGLSPGTVRTGMQVSIKASGLNPISELDPSAHIPPEWPARAVAWLCGPEGAEFAGTDFSIKTIEGRRRVGLPLDGAK